MKVYWRVFCLAAQTQKTHPPKRNFIGKRQAELGGYYFWPSFCEPPRPSWKKQYGLPKKMCSFLHVYSIHMYVDMYSGILYVQPGFLFCEGLWYSKMFYWFLRGVAAWVQQAKHQNGQVNMVANYSKLGFSIQTRLSKPLNLYSRYSKFTPQ